MREIKFRAFMNPSFITDESGMVYNVNPFECPYKKYPIMQYTGLKDKNGKEIYEGDVLQWKFHNDIVRAEVSFSDGFFSLIIDDSHWPLSEYIHLVEKIGTIHENPELLNEAYNA